MADARPRMLNTADLRPFIESAWINDRRSGENTLTFRHHDLKIGVYTYEHIVEQATLWKKGGAEILEANFRTRTLAGDEGTLFVVSPPKYTYPNMDPLSLCLHFAVQGYGFFTTDPKVIELVRSYSKGEWTPPIKSKKSKNKIIRHRIIRRKN